MIDFTRFPSPCYIMEEELLRKNLNLIKSVADRAGVEIILAFKSFAMWRSFSIFREYIAHSTASSVYEARLSLEVKHTLIHRHILSRIFPRSCVVAVILLLILCHSFGVFIPWL